MPYQQPVYVGAAAKKGMNPFYLVGLLGGLALAISAFLPWATAKVGRLEMSITGMGNVSGTGIGSSNEGVRDGIFALGLGILVVVLAVLGLLLSSRGFAIALLVFGLLSSAFMVYELTDINQDMSSVAGSAGFGVYMGLAGALVIVVGGVVPLLVKRK
jgi:hypothetical protein